MWVRCFTDFWWQKKGILTGSLQQNLKIQKHGHAEQWQMTTLIIQTSLLNYETT